MNQLASSSEVLQSLFQNGKYGISDQFLRLKIWGQWPQVVGPSIAAHTMPVSFSNGVLYVWVKNSTWMHEMRFIAKDILDRVNEYAGRPWVSYIKFTLDKNGQ